MLKLKYIINLIKMRHIIKNFSKSNIENKKQNKKSNIKI